MRTNNKLTKVRIGKTVVNFLGYEIRKGTINLTARVDNLLKGLPQN